MARISSFVFPLIAAVWLWLPIPARCGGDDGSRIVLVRATTSAPNEAERNFAQSIARRLSRWLADMDVPHRVVDDEKLSAEGLASAKVVILGYNPEPRAREAGVLRSYVKLGGKLIVFYSADPALAELLHMKLGPYATAALANGWSSMRFRDDATGRWPERVLQESRNIRPVYPAAAGARVIGVWEDAAGQPTRQTACVQSDRGFWVTHVLLDDGDTDSKKQMLLAMIGTYDPSVWRPAAASWLRECGRVGRFRSLPEAVRGLSVVVRGKTGQDPARAALAKAESFYVQATRLYNDGCYPEALQTARTAKRLLTEAYGYTEEPRADKLRGVWAHTPLGLYAGNWDRTCGILAANGITDLFANMAWPGIAHYESALIPQSEVVRLRGDPLAQCLAAARKHKLKIHLWKVCWRMDGAPPALLAEMRKQGRLQVTDTGQTLDWLCPSNPDNVRWEKDAMREVLRKYAVDGLHLDYVRFRDSHTCYCAGCRRNFEAQVGHKIARWPADVTNGSLKGQYFEWRRNLITRLVRDIAAVARDANPRIRMSASVYGKYPSCRDSVAQDWVAWLKSGYLDFVCPMNYTTDLSQFSALTRSQIALAGTGAKIVTGIGVTATESQLDAAEVIDQIAVARREGAAGFVLFDLDRTLEKETLPVLRLGVTAEK